MPDIVEKLGSSLSSNRSNSNHRLGHQIQTDQVDAAILAWFGEALKPEIRPFASEVQAELQDLVTRRQQLVEILTAEQNRSSSLRGTAQADVQAYLDWLRKRIKQLDAQIEQHSSNARHGKPNTLLPQGEKGSRSKSLSPLGKGI